MTGIVIQASGMVEWLVDKEPAKGSKWLAEVPHYTWGSTRGSLYTQITPRRRLNCLAAWCRIKNQDWFPEAAVWELTSPMEKVLFCSRTWGKIPIDGIPTFHPLGRGPFKQNKTNKPFCCFCTIHFQFIKRTVKFVFGIWRVTLQESNLTRLKILWIGCPS